MLWQRNLSGSKAVPRERLVLERGTGMRVRLARSDRSEDEDGPFSRRRGSRGACCSPWHHSPRCCSLGTSAWLGVAVLMSVGCTSVDFLGTRPDADGGPVEVSDNGSPLGGASSGGRGTAGASSGTGASTATGGEEGTPADEQDDLPDPLLDQGQLSEIEARLNTAFAQLFHGTGEDEPIYFELEEETGYIQDVYHEDVRTDSMGYGMLITVQLNRQQIFDRLWGWVKQYMLNTSAGAPDEGLPWWRCDTDGTNCDPSVATDSSSIIATSLFMAHRRWPSGGEHDYEKDGLALLDAMLSVDESSGKYKLFDEEAVLPRLSSDGPEGQINVEYLMPAFYEIWAEQDETRSGFWKEMAQNSRDLLSQVAHEESGLYPRAVTYEGEVAQDSRELLPQMAQTETEPCPGAAESCYSHLTARAFLNLYLDYIWNDDLEWDWLVEQNVRRLDFFLNQGLESIDSIYTLDGSTGSEPQSDTTAHLSLLAVAAGTTVKTHPRHEVFLDELLSLEVPVGEYRYYSGIIYMLSLLVLAGEMTP